jgi:hypothetical protein
MPSSVRRMCKFAATAYTRGMSRLDNPLWSSLTSLHEPLALGAGDARRYPAEVAPFVAVATEGADPGELVAPGETVYMIGARPRSRAGHELDDLGAILQMVAEPPLEAVDGPPVVALGPAHRGAIVELAALVYPHYFRARTPELGRYFGIFDGDTLVAMVGERMGFPERHERDLAVRLEHLRGPQRVLAIAHPRHRVVKRHVALAGAAREHRHPGDDRSSRCRAGAITAAATYRPAATIRASVVPATRSASTATVPPATDAAPLIAHKLAMRRSRAP